MRDIQIESDVNKQFSFSMSDYLNDPIKQLVAKYLTSQELAKRVLPNADSVTPDVNGLQILIVIHSIIVNRYSFNFWIPTNNVFI